MVYVVERYLPCIGAEELERMLARLAQAAEELEREGTPVRYLGSTIVPGDEACFCQFEAPSEEAVAEASRRAAMPFDRIVPGVAVPAAEKGDRR